MSVWLLIAAGLLAWTFVSVALGSWLGRRFREARRGGTIDLTLTGTAWPPRRHEDSSAA